MIAGDRHFRRVVRGVKVLGRGGLDKVRGNISGCQESLIFGEPPSAKQFDCDTVVSTARASISV
jgi:hypothetical protein